MVSSEAMEWDWLVRLARGRVLNIGSGRKPVPGAVNLDAEPSKAPWIDVLADAHHLPFSVGAFDAVLSSHVLEIMEDPAQVLREATRVLRQGGSMGHIVPAAAVTEVQNRPHHPYAHWRRWWDTAAEFKSEFGAALRECFDEVVIRTEEVDEVFSVRCEGKR